MNRWANWRGVVAVLIGCASTAVLSLFQHHFKAGSIADSICELLMLPGMVVATPFHDRGNASPEFLWRSRIAEAAILSALAWLALRARRTISTHSNNIVSEKSPSIHLSGAAER